MSSRTACIVLVPSTMLDSITAKSLIKENMPVVCSENGQFAIVDHMEGTSSIKLAKDPEGQHHYIPLAWVTSVDDRVHVDRSGHDAMKGWSTEPVALESPATSTQAPIVARVMARKLELAALLAAVPAPTGHTADEINMALNTIDGLLTGDLINVPEVVAAEMSRWLEANKHVAQSAVEHASETITSPVIVRAND